MLVYLRANEGWDNGTPAERAQWLKEMEEQEDKPVTVTPGLLALRESIFRAMVDDLRGFVGESALPQSIAVDVENHVVKIGDFATITIPTWTAKEKYWPLACLTIVTPQGEKVFNEWDMMEVGFYGSDIINQTAILLNARAESSEQEDTDAF